MSSAFAPSRVGHLDDILVNSALRVMDFLILSILLITSPFASPTCGKERKQSHEIVSYTLLLLQNTTVGLLTQIHNLHFLNVSVCCLLKQPLRRIDISLPSRADFF